MIIIKPEKIQSTIPKLTEDNPPPLSHSRSKQTMSLSNLCRFPITRYGGNYRPTWTQRWTRVGGKGGSWQFFGHARDMILDNDGQPYAWDGDYGFYTRLTMLAGPHSDWGAFDLVGVLQLDKCGNIYKACGCVSTGEYNLGFFMHAGMTVDEHREKNMYRMTPDVFCIPGLGGKINLTLVTMNNKRIEVYFLSGRYPGEFQSQLPGMHEFYRVARMKKMFAKIVALFSGVCSDSQKEEDCEDELWRRTGYVVY